jgi:hypothetical protein
MQISNTRNVFINDGVKTSSHFVSVTRHVPQDDAAEVGDHAQSALSEVFDLHGLLDAAFIKALKLCP